MQVKQRTAVIIGSGLGGLGSACLLAKAGWKVTVIEKNEQLGGRASQFKAKGFTFDMGPSWYLMPDVFEHFFTLLGEDVHKHLKLNKLAPSYRVWYKDTFLKADIYSDLKKDKQTIEQLETGASEKLEAYLRQAGYQYNVAKDRFMYKNYDSIRDFLTPEMAREGRKLKVLSNMDKYVKKYFKTEAMQKLMQYSLVFLGSSPYNTPALYNIMSHIDFNMGVYYPQGGIYEIVKAFKSIAKKYGVVFRLNTAVKRIRVTNGVADGVELENGKTITADIVISNADIHHTESQLLDPAYRSFSKRYWRKRTLAPSALIMYLGVKGTVPGLTHHNLLFSKDWRKNFSEIFDKPRWPKDPSIYVCKPSETDPNVAPKNHENLFVLVPIASGLKYTDALLEEYSDKILATIEKDMHAKDLRKRIVYKKLFCVEDFAERYNSYQGSALGLAHTLKQTAIFRPDNVSKKVKSLYYVGAGTNPGIGMPITLISAELMYKRLTGDTSTGPLRPDQI